MFGLLFSVIAQSTVTGTVKDETGESLPGATVTIKGTTTGTVTDIDGKYSIKVPGAETILEFSFVGYKAKEVTVGTQAIINVTLSSDNVLDEILVIGYGTTLKTESTSAISSVTSEQISKLPVASPGQALQGLTAGVMVTNNSGAPGGGSTIRVRGNSSILGSQAPLYIIDGVIISTSGSIAQNATGGQESSVLSSINPQDIETMQVLKDAASTAIYGARGANGVIIITTKRGKSGKAKIDFGVWTGIGRPTATYDKLSAAEEVMIRREAAFNDDPNEALPTAADIGWDGVTNTDWVDLIYQDAITNEYQLSVSGGSEKFSYYLSGAYRDEQGTMIGSEFDRYSVRSNIDYNATDKLKIGSSISFSRSLNNLNTNDNNIYGIYSSALLTPSYRPVRDDSGEFVDALPSFNSNAVRLAENVRQQTTTFKFLGNINASYQIIEGLDFRTDFSYDWTLLKEDFYFPSNTAQGRATTGNGIYDTRDIGVWLLEPTLRYNKVLGENHKISAVLGTSWQQQLDESNASAATNYARPTLSYLVSAATPTVASSNRVDYSVQSVFGRVNYSYDEKYLASISLRRDGSSRFGPDNKFGTFWAISGGWNFSQEDFFDVSFIEFGKIRASYGITGNDGIGNFQYLSTFSGGANYLGQAASSPVGIGDPSLGWEESATLDVGIELAMFKNRVNLNAGVFIKKTDRLLFDAPTPASTGFTSFTTNFGELENKGIELELSTINVDKGGFKWSTSFNLSFMKNEIIDLPSGDTPQETGFASVYFEGISLNSFYGLTWLGVDPGTGESRYVDTNGDGSITPDDRTVIGDYAPNALGGLTNSFSYKGLSLDIFFQFIEGVDVYNNTNTFLSNPASAFGMSNDVLRRWQQPGDITDVPRVSNSSSIDYTVESTRWLSDGSYLRLKNITLAYNLPSTITEKIGLRTARVYVQGENLWLLTGYDGPDPEVSTFGFTNTSQGTDFLSQPQNKRFIIGLNIGF